MRLSYPYDLTLEERRAHERLESAISHWWQHFSEKREELLALFSERKEWDLPQWMHEHLGAVSPELMWEYGPGLLGGYRLVITCESARHLRPLVSHLLRRAPKLEGWEFYGYRLPEDERMARLTVEARQGVDLERMQFLVSQGNFNRLDVSCLVPKGYPEDKMNATGFVALESLLGEELLDRWIGYIDYEIVGSFPSECVAAGGLLERTRLLLQRIIADLPDVPWIGRTENTKWTAFELKPQVGAADYPRRQDLLTQISAIPELHKCAFSEGGFDSLRFSKCGETFAYVKIDGAEGLPSWGFQDRSEIDEALTAALEAPRLGTVIGGGTGLRYSYCDLALLDVEKAIPVIRETLARGGVSLRSWLLFFDSDLAAEWIGVFPEAPPPPPTETQ